MHPGPLDVAQIRLDNALVLFDEFVSATIKHPDAATLRGLERRFAERLDIQPSYWSQIKARSRQIGERLARQFEQRCGKPSGWMDQPQTGNERAAGSFAPSAPPAPQVPHAPSASRTAITAPGTPTDPARNENLPQDDDERFIVGLVLTFYRRHPQRARTRLLDLLGEVLTPPPSTPAAARPPKPPAEDPALLWARMQAGVAPLKKKR